MMFQAGLLGLLSSLGTVSKVVLLVLFFFSVISWGIILHKWWAFRSLEMSDRRFLNLYTRSQDYDDLHRHLRRTDESPSAAIFLALLDRLAPEGNGEPFSDRMLEPVPELSGADPEYLNRVMAHVLQEQIAKQEAYLQFLATTGNITPFIGLLGTVLGIINAFREIGAQGTASIAAVAPGVAEALVATAAGLFTAIPAVIAYNYFLARIRRITFRTEAFSIECLNTLQLRFKRVSTRE
jgi:biopolymer transport protein TolQ